MPGAPLTITVDAAARRVAVAGDVDAETVAQLSGGVDDALGRATGSWQLDLTDVTFFPSLAVSAVVHLLRQAATRGQELLVVSEPGSISRRVLEVMGIEVASRSGR